MGDELKRIAAVFYRSDSGNEPVREWLLSLPQADRQTIGRDIALVEFGWPIGMPTCRPLRDGLWEIRSTLDSRRISRVIFCFHEEQLVLLHGFIKKTQQTPKQELELALARQRSVSS